MPDEYCLYSDRSWPTEAMSDEHVFPDALGGSRDFMIRANAEVNSKVSDLAEREVINNPILETLRFEGRVKGKKRRFDELRLREFSLGGTPMPEFTACVRADGIELRPRKPLRSAGPNAYRFLAKDEEEVERRRKEIEESTGDSVHVAHVQEVQLPKGGLQSVQTITPAGLIRFFAKIALAGTYKIVGEPFRASAGADALRALVLDGTTLPSDYSVRLFAASSELTNWGMTHPSARAGSEIGRFTYADHLRSSHVFCLERTGNGIRAWVGIFGFFGFCVDVMSIDPFALTTDSRGFFVINDWSSKRAQWTTLSHVEEQVAPLSELFKVVLAKFEAP